MRFLKTTSCIIVISLLTSLSALHAQPDYGRDEGGKQRQSAFKDKVQFGGGASVQFGTQTLFDVSPKLIYYPVDRIYIGVGLRYLFYRINMDKIYGYGGINQSFIYGGSTFLNFLITETIVAHGEFEALNFAYYDQLNHEMDRKWIGGLFAGGGYRQYFNNGRSFVEILLLYNFTYNALSPYSSPFLPRITVYF